ncbi:hypothetical protein ACFV2Q_34930 [Streptomyces sp. NPDC059650]|uniref:hypothetical protein n=1 Tax=Streptomyces sp. NPDC059650 TaxID=3346896 RepID=UPI0036CD8310
MEDDVTMKCGKVFGAMVIAAAGVMALAGCSFFASEPAAESRCTSTPISPSILKKYSLPQVPHGDNVQFCEGSDKDGFSAQLSFRSDPKDADSYLKSLDMDPATFTDVTPEMLAELTQEKDDGWTLANGPDYKWGMKARDWNGQCLVDYKAYIRKSADWDGQVYIGMYCQA